MEQVFPLQHERPDTEDVKVIGVYSSEMAAKAAIGRLRQQPGFRDYPECFSIDAYEKGHWAEGVRGPLRCAS